MNRPALLNWLAAAAVCLVVGLAHQLDGPSDIEAMTDVASDIADAQASAVLAAATTRRGAP